jgi:hypothetical protein
MTNKITAKILKNIPLGQAVMLYDSPSTGKPPRFTVLPLGHEDYDEYTFKVGACFSNWQHWASIGDKLNLLAQMYIDMWHATAFYGVPVDMVHEAMLAVPEYRNTLADDCLPKEYHHERDG